MLSHRATMGSLTQIWSTKSILYWDRRTPRCWGHACQNTQTARRSISTWWSSTWDNSARFAPSSREIKKSPWGILNNFETQSIQYIWFSWAHRSLTYPELKGTVNRGDLIQRKSGCILGHSSQHAYLGRDQQRLNGNLRLLVSSIRVTVQGEKG